jgi:hypothetical protein
VPFGVVEPRADPVLVRAVDLDSIESPPLAISPRDVDPHLSARIIKGLDLDAPVMLPVAVALIAIPPLKEAERRLEI